VNYSFKRHFFHYSNIALTATFKKAILIRLYNHTESTNNNVSCDFVTDKGCHLDFFFSLLKNIL